MTSCCAKAHPPIAFEMWTYSILFILQLPYYYNSSSFNLPTNCPFSLLKITSLAFRIRNVSSTLYWVEISSIGPHKHNILVYNTGIMFEFKFSVKIQERSSGELTALYIVSFCKTSAILLLIIIIIIERQLNFSIHSQI